MDKKTYMYYTDILRRELIPASGCTEPIALAYASALARDLLDGRPQKIEAFISGSIIKNAKSVTVPNTGGLKGIEAAIAAGVVEGIADKKLEVLSGAAVGAVVRIESFMKECPIQVRLARTEELFDITLEFEKEEHSSSVHICGHHTNVVQTKKDGEICYQQETGMTDEVQGSPMSISEIFEFASTCDLCLVQDIIERQILYNTALSRAGLEGNWGAQIGRIQWKHAGEQDTLMRARARAAAGSDARMSGCELPAVINSGSGNQGITVTMPVVEYAQALHAGREQEIRALVLANLTAIRIKQEIGCLSAYCGAVCAGCAAGAGVAYLHGAGLSVIEHTVVNGLAILSGTICDGAKPSCAAKISMAVEAGIMGFQMAQEGREFVHGEGIIKKGIENTIREVGELGREGMQQTNQVILNIMLKK